MSGLDYYAVRLGECLPGSRIAEMLVPTTIAWFIGTVLLALRLYTRWRIMPSARGWDDVMMILAWMLITIPQVFAIVAATYGFGLHLGCLSLGQAFDVLKLQYIGELPGFLCMLFARLSICIFLLRLFTQNKTWRICIYIIAASNIAINVASTVIPLCRCKPYTKAWNLLQDGTCWSAEIQQDFSIGQGAFSALMDFMLALLPIYFMWKVQVSLKKKIMICGLMSLGCLTAICAILRSVYIPTASSPDATYDAIPIIIFALLECEVAVIVGCLPAVAPFFTQKGWKTSSSSAARPLMYEDRGRNTPDLHGRIAYPGSPWMGGNEKFSGVSTHTAVSGSSGYTAATGPYSGRKFSDVEKTAGLSGESRSHARSLSIGRFGFEVGGPGGSWIGPPPDGIVKTVDVTVSSHVEK